MVWVCVGDRFFTPRIEAATTKSIFHHSNYQQFNFEMVFANNQADSQSKS